MLRCRRGDPGGLRRTIFAMTVRRVVLCLGVMIAGLAAPHGVDAADHVMRMELADIACPDCPEGHAAASHGALSCDVSGHCVGPWLRRQEPLLAARLRTDTVFGLLSDSRPPRAEPKTETPPPRRV